MDRGWVLETSKLNTMAAAARRSWGGSCLGAPGTPGQGGDLLAEPGLLAPLPPQAGSKAHSNWGTLFAHAYVYVPAGVCPGCGISLLEKTRAEAHPSWASRRTVVCQLAIYGLFSALRSLRQRSSRENRRPCLLYQAEPLASLLLCYSNLLKQC